VLKGRLRGLAHYGEEGLQLPPEARALSVYVTGADGRTLPLSQADAEFFSGALGILLFEEERSVAYGGYVGRAALLEQARRCAESLQRKPEKKPRESLPPKGKPKAENEPLPPKEEAALPAPQTLEGAGNSPALKEILLRARALFDPLKEGVGREEAGEAVAAAQSLLDPFPNLFPGARWRRVPYPGTGRHYLEGRYVKNGKCFSIRAIPGSFSPVPPLKGYDRFFRARDGAGYWIRISPLR